MKSDPIVVGGQALRCRQAGGGRKGGALRLSRRGDIFTGYYRNGLSWVPIISGVGPTDDASLTLAVSNISGASPFLGLPAKVTFDNFHVFADRIVC